jgi:hypothetical protein
VLHFDLLRIALRIHHQPERNYALNPASLAALVYWGLGDFVE